MCNGIFPLNISLEKDIGFWDTNQKVQHLFPMNNCIYRENNFYYILLAIGPNSTDNCKKV